MRTHRPDATWWPYALRTVYRDPAWAWNVAYFTHAVIDSDTGAHATCRHGRALPATATAVALLN